MPLCFHFLQKSAIGFIKLAKAYHPYVAAEKSPTLTAFMQLFERRQEDGKQLVCSTERKCPFYLIIAVGNGRASQL